MVTGTFTLPSCNTTDKWNCITNTKEEKAERYLKYQFWSWKKLFSGEKKVLIKIYLRNASVKESSIYFSLSLKEAHLRLQNDNN